MGTLLDLTGSKFGKLKIISRAGSDEDYRPTWNCICDCGNATIKNSKWLKTNIHKDCGCHLLKNKDSKVCSSCGIDKPKSEYHKATVKASGVQAKCIECMSAYKKKRYWSNREEELKKLYKSRKKPENVLQRKKYYQDNKDEYKDRYVKYMEDDNKKKHKSEVSRKYNKENEEKIKERVKKYSQRPEVKHRKKRQHNERQQSDVIYVLKRRLRCRLRHAIKRAGVSKDKNGATMKLVGCEPSFLKKYIEDLFTDDMSWGRISEIDIDHIKPCSKFDLTDPEQQKICFHYSNLQPLWKIDNLKKGNKYENPSPIDNQELLHSGMKAA